MKPLANAPRSPELIYNSPQQFERQPCARSQSRHEDTPFVTSPTDNLTRPDPLSIKPLNYNVLHKTEKSSHFLVNLSVSPFLIKIYFSIAMYFVTSLSNN